MRPDRNRSFRCMITVGAFITMIACFSQIACAAEVYDLCVRGSGPQFTKTIRLKLRVDGVDPGDSAKFLAANIVRLRVWPPNKATKAYAETYEADRCLSAQMTQTIVIRLNESDTEWLAEQRARGDVKRFIELAKRANVLPKTLAGTLPNKGKPYDVMKVHFATNREDSEGVDAKARFTANRGAGVAYGSVEVSIPKNHRIGELESPYWLRFEFWEDPKKHIVLVPRSLVLASKDHWYEQLRRNAQEFGRPGALLFVHGYNVSFEDAARRSAQLSRDMGFEGPTVFFSWPSQDNFLDYPADREAADWSVTDMHALLKDLASQLPDGPIFVIAHSMGNQILTKAFVKLAQENPSLKGSYRELVLAAPDIDAGIFEKSIAKVFLKGEPRVTLYTHTGDMAQKASKEFQGGYPRLGSGGKDIVILKNMDTIDASTIKSDYFLLHSYYGDSEKMLSDLSYLIRAGLSPQKRFGLKEIATARGKYWRFLPTR